MEHRALVIAKRHLAVCAIALAGGLGQPSPAATEPLASVPIAIADSSWRLELSWVFDEARGAGGNHEGDLVNPAQHPRFEVSAVRLSEEPANHSPVILATLSPPPISRTGVLDTLKGSGALYWDPDSEELYMVSGTSLHNFLFVQIYKVRPRLDGGTLALSDPELAPIQRTSLDEQRLRRRNAAPSVEGVQVVGSTAVIRLQAEDPGRPVRDVRLDIGPMPHIPAAGEGRAARRVLSRARPARAADPSDVRVIPPNVRIRIEKVPPSIRKGLPELLSLDHKGRAELVARGDPASRCRAIYAASYHGDLEQLIEWSVLLEDHRQGLRVVSPFRGAVDEGAIEDGRVVSYYAYSIEEEPATVSGLLSGAYALWFGVQARTQEEARTAFEGMPPLERLVTPWVERMIQAKVGQGPGVPDAASVQAKIDALPPEIRWAVVTLYAERYVSHDSRELASAMIAALPPSVLAGLEQGDRFLSADPQFKAHPEQEDRLRTRCLELLHDASTDR